MGVKRITIAIFVLLIGLCAAPVYAQGPALPHAFYGGLEINGAPADEGTLVEARTNGASLNVPGNPILTTEAGRYGSGSPTGVKLLVYGSIADGATIHFYINGVEADQTAAWSPGQVTELNLTVTLEQPEPPSGDNNGSSASAAPPSAPPVGTSSVPTQEPASNPTPTPKPGSAGEAASASPPAPPAAPTPASSSDINWFLVGGIIAGGVVILATIIFVARRTAG